MNSSKAFDEESPAYEAAPPAYITSSVPSTSNPSTSAAGNVAYPPQAHHAQAPSHTLNVEYEGWKGTKARIMSEENSTRLYDIKLSYFSKPHMLITTAPSGSGDGETIGTVSFHTLSSRIDTTVRSTPLPLTKRGNLKYGYRFTSKILGEMEWKTGGHKMDLTCFDAKGVARARFVFANWSMKKCGKFEMLGGGIEEARDELLVTGLAFVQYTIQYIIAVT
jgi:hypothetical protein